MPLLFYCYLDDRYQLLAYFQNDAKTALFRNIYENCPVLNLFDSCQTTLITHDKQNRNCFSTNQVFKVNRSVKSRPLLFLICCQLDLITVYANTGTMRGHAVHIYFCLIHVLRSIIGMSLLNSIFVDARARGNNNDAGSRLDEMEKKIDKLLETSRKELSSIDITICVTTRCSLPPKKNNKHISHSELFKTTPLLPLQESPQEKQ